MALDHALCRKKGFNFVAELNDIAVLLGTRSQPGDKGNKDISSTYPEPFWPLATKAQALKM